MQTMDHLPELIEKHPFLSVINPAFLPYFEECASLRRFASNQQIFHEGNDADHFYLVLSGKIVLGTFVPGLGMVNIQTLSGGDVLGWSWLFPPHRWHFTATTAEPTEVVSLNAQSLRAAAAKDRDFRDELLTRVVKTLLGRLQATRAQLIDLCGLRS